jgi:hypothetical protein
MMSGNSLSTTVLTMKGNEKSIRFARAHIPEKSMMAEEDVGLSKPLLWDSVPVMGLAATISDLGIGRELESWGKNHCSFKGWDFLQVEYLHSFLYTKLVAYTCSTKKTDQGTSDLD